MKIKKHAILFSALIGASCAVAAAPVDYASYRQLDELQLGHLRFFHNIANQPHNDWSRMDSSEPGQGGFDSYRYQLAMMSYAANLANYHYTPAYRDHYEGLSNSLIEKMLRFDVWSFWELTSKGAIQFNPDLTALSEGWVDPVVHQNIMYSGHLMHMIGAHAMLYDSDKYELENSIVFDYNPTGRGLGRQKFEYDAAKLVNVLERQFIDGGYIGIECEPNAVFIECNQHPIIGFKFHDHRNGTNHFELVTTEYLKQFHSQGFLDESNGSIMFFKMLEQNKIVPAEMAWNDGWAGIFMHAWNPGDVQRMYPLLKDKYIVHQDDGTAVIPYKNNGSRFSWDNGFFAALAKEVGDEKTADSLLRYADDNWNPTWVNGGLHYPRNDAFFAGDADPTKGPATSFVSTRVNTLTGNALLALARLNVPEGLLQMVSKPWDTQHFANPFISGVDFPNVYVSRAIFDEEKKSLIATFVRAPDSDAAAVDFSVNNLEGDGTYEWWVGNDLVAVSTKGKVESRDPNVQIRVTDGTTNISMPLSGEVSIAVRRI